MVGGGPRTSASAATRSGTGPARSTGRTRSGTGRDPRPGRRRPVPPAAPSSASQSGSAEERRQLRAELLEVGAALCACVESAATAFASTAGLLLVVQRAEQRDEVVDRLHDLRLDRLGVGQGRLRLVLELRRLRARRGRPACSPRRPRSAPRPWPLEVGEEPFDAVERLGDDGRASSAARPVTASTRSTRSTIPKSFGTAPLRNCFGSNFCVAMPARSPTVPESRDSPRIGRSGEKKPPALSLPAVGLLHRISAAAARSGHPSRQLASGRVERAPPPRARPCWSIREPA